MAEKSKKDAAKADKKVEKEKNKQKKGGFQRQLLMLFAVVAAILFLPLTLLLVLGMLPTPMAIFTEPTRRKKTKMLCVGAMNFAGCSPFVFQLVASEISFENAFAVISNPTTIIIMYSAALLGYMIDWSMTGIVAGVMYERGRKRQEMIKKTQEDLVERWGSEVTGEKELDEYGFSIEP